MTMNTSYGDISPRTAGHIVRELLERSYPHMVFELFGQSKPLPGNDTLTMIFRRYEALDPTPKPLTEGVSPSGSKLRKTDVSVTLQQYGDLIIITDIVEDTHEDPVLKEATEILSEQSAQMIELVRVGVLTAGTNVFLANGSERSSVNTPLTRTLQRRITRALKRQNALKITKVIKPVPEFNSEPVAAAYVGVIHTDLESDVRNMDGFVPTEKYGQMTPFPSEIGKVEEVRYVTTTLLGPWADSGGAYAGSGTAMLSTGGVKADVYPVLYLAQNAYGIVAHKGKNAIAPIVLKPKPSPSDRLGQRGSAGWKSIQGAVILNDLWMCRAEVAVTS